MISTRDFNYNDADYNFTYKILVNRYQDKKTLIEGVSPDILPTYEQHKDNIKTFNVIRILCIGNQEVGFGYVTGKNIFGFFYVMSLLKHALKTTGIHHSDFSAFFFKDILSRAPKNTPLIAHVSVNNKLANKTAARLCKHVANTYVYINE
jgi:hypothetical protein